MCKFVVSTQKNEKMEIQKKKFCSRLLSSQRESVANAECEQKPFLKKKKKIHQAKKTWRVEYPKMKEMNEQNSGLVHAKTTINIWGRTARETKKKINNGIFVLSNIRQSNYFQSYAPSPLNNTFILFWVELKIKPLILGVLL